jgi:hypothetical protein
MVPGTTFCTKVVQFIYTLRPVPGHQQFLSGDVRSRVPIQASAVGPLG